MSNSSERLSYLSERLSNLFVFYFINQCINVSPNNSKFVAGTTVCIAKVVRGLIGSKRSHTICCTELYDTSNSIFQTIFCCMRQVVHDLYYRKPALRLG